MTMVRPTTPCYVIDVDALRRNLSVLRGVMDRTGAHILLAQKAFSCYGVYPLVAEYLSGATASGLYEAKLWHEEISSKPEWQARGIENHVYNPAFQEKDIEEIFSICDHIVFNSPAQLLKYGARAKAAGLAVGLRINPEFSTQTDHAIYDPCAPGSRLGTTLAEFEDMINSQQPLGLIDGLHFHTLCEQDSDDLEKTWEAFEAKFGQYLHSMKWVNFGGGHHITRPGYDIERLERLITRVRDIYKVEVYLEPGEAIALNAGYLYTTVLEVRPTSPSGAHSVLPPTGGTEGGLNIAIVDASAACHMPDVIEMPYTPPLQGAQAISSSPQEAQAQSSSPQGGIEGGFGFHYRLGGPTCLAGDIIGDYGFDHPLREGEVLQFNDMAIYSMVKNNTFNGMPLPTIYLKNGEHYQLWKQFGYEDFKCRL